ncbi:MAG TPA: XRE family transcriptional regulator [Curvibacter sp.]|nr:XRE family transcriptional regulator [Curvibacter sp.]
MQRRKVRGVKKSNLRQQFGQRIKELRAIAKLSQEDLADRCGFARSYMSRIERGGANTSLDAIQKLADGLGVVVADLFTTSTPQPAPRQELFVPYAADNTCFHSGLKNAGKYTVGKKEDEATFEDFEDALEYLRQMGHAMWRRPNPSGKWSIVAAVRWAPLGK